MTWADATTTPSGTWSAQTSFTPSWGAASGASALGNFMRFVDADPLADASEGVDFNNTFSTENPWVFTTRGPVSFRVNREEPT